MAHNSAVFNHDLAHAELNALLSLSHVDWAKTTPNNPREWALYTTMEPCPLCLGAFYMLGLRQLHYAARDPYAGGVNLMGTIPYLGLKSIRVHGPDPHLESLSVALNLEAMLKTGPVAKAEYMCDLWRPTAPAGVALAEYLFEHHVLTHLRTAGEPTAEMVSVMLRVLEQIDTGGEAKKADSHRFVTSS
jgi:hypothetical protein